MPCCSCGSFAGFFPSIVLFSVNVFKEGENIVYLCFSGLAHHIGVSFSPALDSARTASSSGEAHMSFASCPGSLQTRCLIDSGEPWKWRGLNGLFEALDDLRALLPHLT